MTEEAKKEEAKKVKRSRWRPYKEAKEYVRSLEFKNPHEYLKWTTSADRPWDIPTTPNREYKGKGWTNWTDFLGTKLTYDEAREAIKSMNLTSSYEYQKRREELPRGVPKQPHKTFKDKGWKGWKHYLNIEKVEPLMRPKSKTESTSSES